MCICGVYGIGACVFRQPRRKDPSPIFTPCFRFVMCNGLFALCVCADAVALPFGMRTVRLIGGTDVAGSLQYDLSVFSRGWHGNVCTFGLGGRCWVFFRSCIGRTGFRKRTKRGYLISYQIAYISAKYDWNRVKSGIARCNCVPAYSGNMFVAVTNAKKIFGTFGYGRCGKGYQVIFYA